MFHARANIGVASQHAIPLHDLVQWPAAACLRPPIDDRVCALYWVERISACAEALIRAGREVRQVASTTARAAAEVRTPGLLQATVVAFDGTQVARGVAEIARSRETF